MNFSLSSVLNYKYYLLKEFTYTMILFPIKICLSEMLSFIKSHFEINPPPQKKKVLKFNTPGGLNELLWYLELPMGILPETS